MGGNEKPSWMWGTRRGVAAAALLALTASAGIVSGAQKAAAQGTTISQSSDADFGDGLEPFPAEGPLLAVVSLSSQQLRVFDKNGVVAQTRVSTGRKGFETPEGVFSIIERKVEHTSNLYDDASMPFMQRLTWSGVALHEGQVPNYRASHGCIRLPNEFAERLYRTTRSGTRVVIVSHDATPLPIAHRGLLQPGVPIPAEPVATIERARFQAIGGLDERPSMVGLRLAGADSLVPPVVPAKTPAEITAETRVKRALAEKRLADATKAANQAKPAVKPRLVEQGKAEKTLRQALAMKRRAEGRVEAAADSFSRARADASRAAAETAHLEALMELAITRGREEAAREMVAQSTAAAQSIRDLVAKHESDRQAAQNEIRALARRLAPVTLLVSRQMGRVYVRQANQPVMDAPISIYNSELPIGTHIFKAIDSAGSDGALSWVALTVETPGGGSPLPIASSQSQRPRRGEAAPSPRGELADPLATARAALERFALPDAVLARVALTLQPGSTLIVSDLGPSIETGPGTDLVVQTKGEEQAAANIAKFIAKKKAEELALASPPTPAASSGTSRGRPPGSMGLSRTGSSGNWNRW